jgi:hypothetical protein
VTDYANIHTNAIMDAVTKHWRQISEAPGYEVSDTGEVRRLTNSTRGKIGDPITLSDFEGYKVAQLRTNGKKQHFRVHRLVLAAFVGPSDQFVNHKNGVRHDNRLKNLEYCTNQENLDHAKYVLGKHHMGGRNPNATLTEDKIRPIFDMFAGGATQSEIARSLGVNRSVICRILKREMWGHVSITPHTAYITPPKQP